MNASKVERKLGRALTVEDLIAELEQYPKDARVVFACDYGDHSHTDQALPIENVEELTGAVLYESGYSQSGLAIREMDEDDEDSEEPEQEGTPVIVLR